MAKKKVKPCEHLQKAFNHLLKDEGEEQMAKSKKEKKESKGSIWTRSINREPLSVREDVNVTTALTFRCQNCGYDETISYQKFETKISESEVYSLMKTKGWHLEGLTIRSEIGFRQYTKVDTCYCSECKKSYFKEKFENGTFEDKIRYGYFENEFDYEENKDAYRKEENRLNELFKTMALEEVGLTGHPNAEKIYAKAWEDGHADGLNNVFCHLRELAEIVK
jgi:hypothetical protein